jgi:hypothetical protein
MARASQPTDGTRNGTRQAPRASTNAVTVATEGIRTLRGADPPAGGRRRRLRIRAGSETRAPSTEIRTYQGRVVPAIAKTQAPAMALSTAPTRIAKAGVAPESPAMATAGNVPATAKTRSVRIADSMVLTVAWPATRSCRDRIPLSRSFPADLAGKRPVDIRPRQSPGTNVVIDHSREQGQPKVFVCWRPFSSIRQRSFRG